DRSFSVTVDADGNMTGTAEFISSDGPRKGNVEGKINGKSAIFDVDWNYGLKGHYEALIGPDGRISGSVLALPSFKRFTFENAGQPWFRCTSSEFCEDYADKAVLSAQAMRNEGCALPNPPARWAIDKQAHINFCMSKASTADPALEAENQARLDAHAACTAQKQKEADDKAKLNETLCGDFANEKVATFGMIGQMDCAAKAGIPAVLDAAAIKQECMTKTPLASQDELAKLKEPMRATVSACFAEVKAKGGALPPEIGGGNAAGVDAAAQAEQPAPEQCTVVNIIPKDQGVQPPPPVAADKGNGPPQDQGNGLTVQKSAAAAECTAGQPCVFTIKVTSKAPNQPGPIVVKDIPDNLPALNFSDDSFFAAPPTWVCSKGDTFTCTNPGPVPPEGLTLNVAFVPGTKATAKTFRNCASIDTKPGPNDGNLAPEPSCAEVALHPAPPPIAEGKPSQAGPLTLVKRASGEVCKDNRTCGFVIEVTNTSAQPFNGTVEFNDELTGDGTIFGSESLVGAQPWSCPRAGNNFGCTAQLALAPNEKKAFPFTASFGANDPAKILNEMKNCATLKDAPNASCASVALPAPPPAPANAAKLKLTKSAQPCKLNDVKDRFECNFSISVENVGDAPFKGPITIDDVMPGIDGLEAGVTTGAPWTCTSSGDAQEGKRACNDRDASLGRLENILLPLAVTVPKNMKGLPCQVDNTATVEGGDPAQEPAKATAMMPGVIPDPAIPGKCKLPDQPNLKVEKTLSTKGAAIGGAPAQPMTCTVEGKCRFNILVRNAGTARFVGEIHLSDDVKEQLPQHMEFVPTGIPGWTCNGIHNSTSASCVHSQITLEPGQATDALLMDVMPGSTWKKNDTLTNCAELTFPLGGGQGLGNDPGTNVSDDKACASVKLDPFSVKVTKTGDQSCVAGSDCHFQIRLFNPGPIDHNAPVTISDKLSGLASAPIVSINPPLPCAVQPTQIPFSCTSPGPVRLDLDAADGSEFGPKTFDMIVRLPANAAQGPFSNCADVSDGAANTSGQSCVSVQAKPAPPATTADLVIAKTAGVQTCGEAKPCDFKITVTNKSAQAYPGGISIFDLMAADAAPMTQYKFASSPAAPWVCIGSAAPGIQCNHPGPLAAGASVDLLLSLQPIPGSIGDAKFVNNCANIDGEQAA
ncbi:hypothetical protein JMG10_46460, partial [Nostoc ellipsosporum NOK]|nr:hypothetical protein [Nostoc ellipsosporum NOK]